MKQMIKQTVRNTALKTAKLLTLGSILLSPIASHATVVKDINVAMTELLGHSPVVTNVYQAQTKGLDAGGPEFQPWSSGYWPDILGGIANHYRDHSKFGNMFFFLLKYGKERGRIMNDFKDVCEKNQKWSPDELNRKLAPSEKYDLLLGDTDFTFTRSVLDEIDFRAKNHVGSMMKDGKEVDRHVVSEGDDNSDQFADVQGTYSKYDSNALFRYWRQDNASYAYWSGICDGWSPAAVTLPRPSHSVTLTGAAGHVITFTPDDLKALGDYMFARTNNDYMTTMNYHFAGRACSSDGNPDRNDDNGPKPGRIKDFRCNDVDAGVWHMALLNRVGMDKMGFVFEIDNNKKVNNHPVSNYTLKYFNPSTGKEGSLKDSMVPKESVRDVYADRRNDNTVYLVGVRSKFRYLNYQWPESHHDAKWNNDSAAQDDVKEKEYAYDLELDAQGNILGGEWGERKKDLHSVQVNGKDQDVFSAQLADQPDFIWMAAPKNLPHSEMSADTFQGALKDPSNPRPFGNMNWAWDGDGRHLPSDWVRAAKEDEKWQAPVVGKLIDAPGLPGGKDVVPTEAKSPSPGAILKSAQPLSNIVMYLFDQSRDAEQK